MVNYKKAEKDMIEAAKEYFVEHATHKSIKDRQMAKIPEVLKFYHGVSRLVNTKGLHDIMDDILLKFDPGYVSDEKVSDALKKAEDLALIKVREEADIREQQAIEEEAKKLADEAEQKQIALIAKRDAKLKALQVETERVEAQRLAAEVAAKKQADANAKKQAKLKAQRQAEIDDLEAEKERLLKAKKLI